MLKVCGKATCLIAIAAVLATTMVGCARPSTSSSTTQANDPGITDTTITLGSDTPLSGGLAGPGSCALAGMQAYLYAANAAGGIKFGDGKTRTVKIKSYDDAYDPSKAVSNFRQMISQDVFADVGGLGSANNLAIMPIATQQKVPLVFPQSGSSVFSSHQKTNSWTIGWQPTYHSEGEAFGKFLVASNKPLTIAVLSQDDDSGEDYFAGLEAGIKGSQVKVVAHSTYEASDPTVSGQVTKLAATKADVFFDGATQTPLSVASLLQAQQLGWLPAVFLPSITSPTKTVVDPGHGQAYPALYTTAFSKSPFSPAYAKDADVQKFLGDMKTYASDVTTTIVPQCVWGYGIGATLEAAFQGMKSPTRAAFMDSIHNNIRNLKVPLLLPGIVANTSSRTMPPVNGTQVQKLNGETYQKTDSFEG